MENGRYSVELFSHKPHKVEIYTTNTTLSVVSSLGVGGGIDQYIADLSISTNKNRTSKYKKRLSWRVQIIHSGNFFPWGLNQKNKARSKNDFYGDELAVRKANKKSNYHMSLIGALT